MFGRTKKKPLADLEGGAVDIPTQELLDYDDASWVLDHHRKNLIQKIQKPEKSWHEVILGHLGRKEPGQITEGHASPDRHEGKKSGKTINPREGAMPEDPTAQSPDSGHDALRGEEIRESYRINLAELQRLRLRQLERKLVQHVVDLRYDAREPAGWADDLRDYGETRNGPLSFKCLFRGCVLIPPLGVCVVSNKPLATVQALQDYDYMCQHIWQPNDPFYVTGERFVERMMMQSAMRDMENEADRLHEAESALRWETAGDLPSPIGGTRDGNFWEVWWKSFRQRVGVAAVGGIFLIAPMWLMVLHNTLYTTLVSTTVFVVVFGLLMALCLDKMMEVMSATAAYAAVLVVFVGLTTEGTASPA